jgi:hypothetical protein
MTNKIVAVLWLCAALLTGTSFAADEHVAPGNSACSPPGYRTDIRPDHNGPPTKVTLGIRMADLSAIDDVNQTITVDFVVRRQWVDTRLIGWEGCRLATADIWFPELVLKNSGRMFERWPQTVSIEEGGKITFQQRLSGTFSSYQQFDNYPFDKQEIALRFFLLDWTSEKVKVLKDPVYTGMADLLNISDWQITAVDSHVEEEQFEATGNVHDGLIFTVKAERYLDYYIWKILVPIALIVSMSWCVFWIDPSHFGSQIGFSATTVLTIIAFIFATTNLVPRLGYFTLLDKYIAGATVFVFLALLQSLTTGYLVSRDQKIAARRIDLASRILFPSSFVIFCLWLLRTV